MSSANLGAPRFSVVMPTYNRRDTILRAIQSVRAQQYEDWELIVVDDGSTDRTRDAVIGLDPRIRLIVQENQGVAGARNTGLSHARGELIGFLDSDDAWPAHHLGLAAAFFDAHPNEEVLTSEFWEDFGDHAYVKHFQVETGTWFPATAKRIHAHAFDAPPPEGDPYLWFYETRARLGEWARAPLADTPYFEGAHHYRGHIFQGWRWGWLMALQPTVLTRRALEVVGPFDTSYRVASDFGFMAGLSRAFAVNLLSVPGCIKHELADGGRQLAESHLVTGRTAVRFHEDVLGYFEELFWKPNPTDPELRALRGFHQALVAQAALRQGAREVARAQLEQATETYPGPDTRAMLWLSRLPQDRLAALAYRGTERGARWARRLRELVVHGSTP